MSDSKPIRCAIYTRKSSEEGLDQAFNSLDAQREAGEAYIASQKSKGWVCLEARYDDGGISGGTMERPALQRLLSDLTDGLIDCVVVYKVDRLTRSVRDFGEILDVFESSSSTFVSVTEHFNTTDPAGKMVLNMILSFAQYERELASERTRDKIAATRRKGLWSGGRPILGYDIDRQPGGNRLVVNESEAEQVRAIYELYLEEGSLQMLARVLRDRDWSNKEWTGVNGKPMGGGGLKKSQLQRMLTNVTYLGKVAHHEHIYEGQHEAIIDQKLFGRVATALKDARCVEHSAGRNTRGALLKGVMRCSACDSAMVHHFATRRTKAGPKVHRYYVCSKAQKLGYDTCPAPSLPAEDLEAFAVDQIKACSGELDVLIHAVRRAQDCLREQAEAIERELAGDIGERARVSLEAKLGALHERLLDEDEIAGAVESFDPVWDSLTSEERERLVGLLIERVEYDADAQTVSVHFREEALCPA